MQLNYSNNNTEYIKYIPYFIHFKYLWKVLYIFIISNNTDYEPISHMIHVYQSTVCLLLYIKKPSYLDFLFQFFKEIKYSQWEDHVIYKMIWFFSKLSTCKNKVHLHWFRCMHIVCSDVKMSLIFRLFSKSDLIPHLP